MIVQNTCVNKYAYLKEQGPETDEDKKDIKNERIQTLKVFPADSYLTMPNHPVSHGAVDEGNL